MYVLDIIVAYTVAYSRYLSLSARSRCEENILLSSRSNTAAISIRNSFSAVGNSILLNHNTLSSSNLRVVQKICKNTRNCKQEVKDIKLHDIDVKFTRNKTDNLLTKTQGLMNMLQAGIHPRIAILHCGLFSDPEQVYQDSKPYLEATTQQQQIPL